MGVDHLAVEEPFDAAGDLRTEREHRGERVVDPEAHAGEERVPLRPGLVPDVLGRAPGDGCIAVGRHDCLPGELRHVDPRLHRKQRRGERAFALGDVVQGHQPAERVTA